MPTNLALSFRTVPSDGKASCTLDGDLQLANLERDGNREMVVHFH
jgi:hypothetical protein